MQPSLYSLLQECSAMCGLFLFATHPAEFSCWESLWSRYSLVIVKSLSGWNSACFSWRPWALGDWCPTSHVMLDKDPGAIVIPGPLLLLLFISKGGKQQALLLYEPLPRTLLRFAECVDQWCIPLLIWDNHNKKFPPHSRKVLLLMSEKLLKSLQIDYTIQ